MKLCNFEIIRNISAYYYSTNVRRCSRINTKYWKWVGRRIFVYAKHETSKWGGILDDYCGIVSTLCTYIKPMYVRMAERSKAPDSSPQLVGWLSRLIRILVFDRRRGFKSHFWQLSFLENTLIPNQKRKLTLQFFLKKQREGKEVGEKLRCSIECRTRTIETQIPNNNRANAF